MNSSTSWPSTSRKYSATVRAGKPDAGARSRRLVHLAVDQRRLVDDLALLHLEPEVVALAGALADAGEDREPAVLGGDVVDQLHDEDGLADAGAAEEADLAAAGVGRQQVDDLDAGLEGLDRHVLIDELGLGTVDRPPLGVLDFAHFVNGLADDVHDPAEGAFPDRNGDMVPGIHSLHPAHEAVGGVHGHAPHDVIAQVLGDLDDQVSFLVVDGGVGYPDRVIDLRKHRGEVYIHNGADNLNNPAFVHSNPEPSFMCALTASVFGSAITTARFRVRIYDNSTIIFRDFLYSLFADSFRLGIVPYRASAPAMISMSSLVMVSCRARLYLSVSFLIISPALEVALSIAVIRAPNSDASDSSSARKICTSRFFLMISSRTSSSDGSKTYPGTRLAFGRFQRG